MCNDLPLFHLAFFIMKKLVATLTAILFSLSLSAQVLLEKMRIMDNKLEILVPKGFVLVTGQRTSAGSVASGFKPTWLLSGEDGRVRIGSTYGDSVVDDNGIPGYTDQLIRKVNLEWKKVEMLDDGILLQDGKNIGYIKFYSKDKRQKTFHYMFYMSLGDRPLLFHVTCDKKQKEKWETVVEQMAASIRLVI